jgi:hypothetical protein
MFIRCIRPGSRSLPVHHPPPTPPFGLSGLFSGVRTLIIFSSPLKAEDLFSRFVKTKAVRQGAREQVSESAKQQVSETASQRGSRSAKQRNSKFAEAAKQPKRCLLIFHPPRPPLAGGGCEQVPLFQWYRECLPLQLRARKRVSGSQVAAKELAELEMRKPSRKTRAARRKTAAISFQLSAFSFQQRITALIGKESHQPSAISFQQRFSAAPCFRYETSLKKSAK